MTLQTPKEIRKKKKIIVGNVVQCFDYTFHGINCLIKGEDEIGFEGCYNDDVNHPDPRPAHRIWIKEVHAEKLFKLFTEQSKLLGAMEQIEDEIKFLSHHLHYLNVCLNRDDKTLRERLSKLKESLG